jgi:hypothetical protein
VQGKEAQTFPIGQKFEKFLSPLIVTTLHEGDDGIDHHHPKPLRSFLNLTKL